MKFSTDSYPHHVHRGRNSSSCFLWSDVIWDGSSQKRECLSVGDVSGHQTFQGCGLRRTLSRSFSRIRSELAKYAKGSDAEPFPIRVRGQRSVCSFETKGSILAADHNLHAALGGSIAGYTFVQDLQQAGSFTDRAEQFAKPSRSAKSLLVRMLVVPPT